MLNKTLLLASMVALASCKSVNDPGPPQPLSELPRSLTANELQVAESANQFAFALFKRISAAQPGENVFVSPLSVGFSLGMTMNGASGTTLDEMRSTLGFGAAELSQINDGYRGLMALEAGLDPSTTFEIANSVWYRQTLSVNQSFVDQVKQTFDAEVRSSPFDASTVTQVNSWVNDKTHGKISTILDEISPDNVMFLINAIYFKGSWREQFDPANTRDAAFAALGGDQTVKMMHRPAKSMRMGMAGNATFTIGELVYGNSAFVMTVLLPASSTDVDALAATLDATTWNAAVGALHDGKAEVSLPRLTLEYKRSLKSDLQALGMHAPFVDGGADFSAMSPVGKQLFIAFVMHKTFVKIDEVGTEAAAVTNTGVSLTSMPPCFCVDRPFIFAIRERFSGTILFIGKIVRIPASS